MSHKVRVGGEVLDKRFHLGDGTSSKKKEKNSFKCVKAGLPTLLGLDSDY